MEEIHRPGVGTRSQGGEIRRIEVAVDPGSDEAVPAAAAVEIALDPKNRIIRERLDRLCGHWPGRGRREPGRFPRSEGVDRADRPTGARLAGQLDRAEDRGRGRL